VKKKRVCMKCVTLVLVLVMCSFSFGATTITQAINDTAGYLVSNQAANGTWVESSGYTGAIVAGLVNAYDITGTVAYRTAAEKGGIYIVNTAGGNFYGDEAYGLTMLSEASATPASNAWRTQVSNFYQEVINGRGTASYITALKAGYAEASAPVYYLAQHTMAACYVNATDKGVWRSELINTLAGLTDTDFYPVMALGAAVQALASTGAGLDATVIGGSWGATTLADLPAILAARQVGSGAYADTFAAQLNDDTYAGYTEDAAFATLGLVAADNAGWSAEILAARLALSNGVDGTGRIDENIIDGGAQYYAYVGETLQALPEPATLSLLALGSIFLARSRKRKNLC